MKTKNILVCVSGLTPQIVTETLFCLTVQKKIRVDELYILTTKRGRDVIVGIDDAPYTPKIPLKTELKELCKKYKIKPPLFENNDDHIIVAKEESLELSDIRTDKHNVLFPNKTSEFISRLASDLDSTLYCSISGGRKSMSVHLSNVLSLFARENDKLLHVLTKEEHEFKGFYPINNKEARDLELAEIPFVRLRSLLPVEIKERGLLKYNFDQIVQFAQKQLKVISDKNKVIIDIGRRELRYGNNLIILEPLEFLFFYYFVDSKNRGVEKITVANFLSDEGKDRFIEYFGEFFPNYYIKEKRWYKKGFVEEDFRQRRSKVNKKLKELFDDSDIEMNFSINVHKKYGDSAYYIKADKNRFLIKN